jgi:predicted ATPase
MYLRTLGGLVLEGSSFNRPKLFLLLAYLALEGPKDRAFLAELFWPTAAEPMTSLRMALSQLRQGAPGVLKSEGARIGANVETDAVQLLRLLERNELTSIPDIYSGAFLQGLYLPGLSPELEEWIYGTREFLAGRVREALLRVGEGKAAAGDFMGAAQDAEEAYRVPGAPEPAPEELTRLYQLLVAGESFQAADLQKEARDYGLMLSQSRDDARKHLYKQRVKRGDSSPIPNNLPSRHTSFVGRDFELVELTKLLTEANTRLITVAGAGGVGKSRLAVQAAYGELQGGNFPDGIYFVLLDALSEPHLIPAGIASTLGIRLSGSDGPLTELTRILVDKQLLLILDNYEHLMAGATVASELIQHCPKLKLLITSRERLNLEEEQVFVLKGLPLPTDSITVEDAQYQDAVQLFLQRAKRSWLDFTLTTHNLPHVLAICRLLEGTPLGIELAAAWVRMIPVADIAGEIERNLDFLTASSRNVIDRHRSLRATFEHSWGLLSAQEKAVLRRLSVFVGGFTREAAAQVADASIPVIASLVDKSLLRILESGRYDRHPLLYQYTQEKLREHPKEQAETQAKHADYFLGLAEAAEPQLQGREQTLWLKRLEVEHDNLRSALRWALGRGGGVVAARLGGAIWRFWQMRGYLSEGRGWLEQALVLLESETTDQVIMAARAKVLKGAGVLAWAQGEHVPATTLFEKALALFRELGDRDGVAALYNNLGVIALHRGDYARAMELIEASLTLRREQRDIWGIATCLNNLGATAGKQGDNAQAQSYYRESLDLYRQLGNKTGVAFTLNNLGDVTLLQGNNDQAYTLYAEALAVRRELGDRVGVAASLARLGAVALRQSNATEAQLLYGESLTLLWELGDKERIAENLMGFAAIAAAQKQLERSARLWGAAEAVREAIGAPLAPGDDRTNYEREMAAVRAQFSEAAFATAWTQGRAMSLEEAVAFALASPGSTAAESNLSRR